jgi:hypothetical protein
MDTHHLRCAPSWIRSHRELPVIGDAASKQRCSDLWQLLADPTQHLAHKCVAPISKQEPRRGVEGVLCAQGAEE